MAMDRMQFLATNNRVRSGSAEVGIGAGVDECWKSYSATWIERWRRNRHEPTHPDHRVEQGCSPGRNPLEGAS
jgi:hypothetical protein